jgi:hypothetical protein
MSRIIYDEMFAVVLGGNRKRADAIFASVRGVDRKIQLIKGAAIGLSGQPWEDLDALMVRVKKATDVRGQIAHVRSVQNGAIIRITARTEGGRIVETVGADKIEQGRMELHKNDCIFTTDELLLEYERFHMLFGDMVRIVEAAR